MLGLRTAGKRVPEDVSIIGVDDSLRGVVPRLELTTIRLKLRTVGKEAFSMIEQQCNGKKVPSGIKKLITPNSSTADPWRNSTNRNISRL